MKRFLLFLLIISVAFISIFVKDNFFNLSTEEGSLIKEQLIKTVSAQSDPSQTKSCSCSSGGCYCEITFSNFISDGYELTSASIDVDDRGDLNSSSEYITVYTDGSNRGDCCTGNCGQCSSYVNCSSYNVTTAASDDSLVVRCDASSGVNYCSTYLDCRVTLSWSEQLSCTSNGESCSSNSDCCSGNCAEDYEDGDKYCAPAGQCVHGSGVTTGSDSQTKTDCCYRSSGSCDTSVGFNNFISSGCSLNSASLDINEGGDTNGGSEEIEYYVDGNYKETCRSDQDWGCPIADWSNCWDGDVTSEAGDNSLTVLADGQDDADYVGVKATLSYSYSCGTLNYYNDGGCSSNGSYVCDGGDWIDHCTSGEQDCDETGVDCGGSDCTSCISPPSVETNDASGIQETQATLNGNLIDMGGASSCDVWFEWGTDTFYGNETNHTAKSSTGSFSDSITGLNSNTTYHFRAVAENPGGISYGSDNSFTTSLANQAPGSGGGPSGGDATGFAWIGANCTDPSGSTCNPMASSTGWISFNSGNPGINCEGTVYGVSVDYDSGEVSGSAFVGVGEDDDNQDCNIGEETVGWLYFDADNDSLVPSTPSFAGGEPVYVDGRRVKGWAPILGGDGQGNYREIVSWVRFDGTNHSVKVNGDGTIGTLNDTNHYAWAGGGDGDTGTVLGWIDLNPALGNANVDASSTIQLPEPNHPPEVNFDSSTADFEETVEDYYCNVSKGTGSITLNWEYNDPDGDTQSSWEMRILHGGDIVVSASSSDSFTAHPGDVNSFQTFVTTDSDHLDYGTAYNWEVKVEDQGTTSGWIAASGYEFTTTVHPWPYPKFSIDPPLPETGTLVTFEDESTCYNSPTGDGQPCSGDSVNASYLWNFGDSVTSNVEGTATHTYSSVDDYIVELEITDNLGTCSETKSLQTILPLPEWEEIAP